MRRLIKFLSLGFLMFSIVGCSCSKEEIVESTLEKSNNVSNKKLTTQEIYDYMRENDVENVNKWFVQKLMEEILDIPNSTTRKAVYDLKVKEFFEKEVLDKEEYKINGVFNEELLVADLKADMYVIDTSKTLSSGTTYDLGLKYDYSDYVERYKNYDIYMEMIKEDYISKNKVNLLDNSKTRIISVFSSDDLEEMETIVSDLFDGKYDSLSDLEEIKREEAREEIGRQYCENLGLTNEYYDSTSCTPTTSNTTYDDAIYNFSVCENNQRCTLAEGLEYQIKLINETNYITEQIVNKNTTDILYSEALTQLLREDVASHLRVVIDGEDGFLINGLYNNDSKFNETNIILSEGHPNGDYQMGDSATRTDKFYLVTVRVVDSNSTNMEDKELAYSKLLDKVDAAASLVGYLEDLDIEITDPDIKEYYNSLIGNK